MRLKDITTLNPQYRGKELYNNVSFVPMESLRNGSIDLKDISFAEGKGKYTYFGNGDLLVAKVTPCFENGNIAIADNLEQGVGFGSSEIFVLRMKKGFLNSYLFYLSQTSKFQDAACATMCGVGGLKRISPLFMRTYELDLPVLSEQQRIVEKLDTQLSSIDKRISVLEQQLAAYARLKKSVIHQAVTRGLNPNVTLKDSGIEWIGMIPEHWVTKRVMDVCKVVCGATPKEDQLYWDGDIIWISPSDMTEFGEIERGARTITNDGYQSCGTTLVPKNSIIMSTRAPIGKTNIALNEMCTNQGCKCLTSKSLNMRYMLYTIWSKKENFQALGRGTTFIELSTKDLSLFCLALPPLSEQQEIANYLDEKCAKIDAAIENITKQIDASKRLRKAIINEAISG